MHSECVRIRLIRYHPFGDLGASDVSGTQSLSDPGDGDGLVRAVRHREHFDLHPTNFTGHGW